MLYIKIIIKKPYLVNLHGYPLTNSFINVQILYTKKPLPGAAKVISLFFILTLTDEHKQIVNGIFCVVSTELFYKRRSGERFFIECGYYLLLGIGSVYIEHTVGI